MLSGLTFTVVPFSIDIGLKRKKILEDIIIKNEGKIIKLEKINNKLIPDFILTSKNVKNIFDIFPRKQIGAIPKEERCNFLNNVFKRIVNFEWLSNCVKEKKIIDVDDYVINIEELSVKQKSKSRISSQNNKISEIEELKKRLNISSNNSINELINDKKDNNNINSISLNSSQNSNNYLSSSNSFISSSLDENEFNFNMNELSDEELFNQIKNHVLNKKDNINNNNINNDNSEEENVNKIPNSINSQSIPPIISNSFNSNIDTMDTTSNYNYSESQEMQSHSNFSENFGKNRNISVPKPFIKNKKMRRLNSNYFAFNLGKSNMSINKNKHLTDEFEKILEFHTNEGNKFEALAYRKVIGILKKYKNEINDPNKIPKIKGIGPKITEKIKEILITGKCRKSDNVSNENKNKCLK